MQFSRKMCIMITLKVTKNPELYPFSREYSFEKATGGSYRSFPAFLGLMRGKTGSPRLLKFLKNPLKTQNFPKNPKIL